jgi:Ni,Fe-hydrogenase III large subunit
MSYILALDTFAAAWRGQQRLIVTVDGEFVTEVHYRGDYDEESHAHRLARLNLEQALQHSARLCPDSPYAHTLAFCQAVETLNGSEVPERAAYIRCVVAELERLAAHLTALEELFDALGILRSVEQLHALHAETTEAMAVFRGDAPTVDLVLPGGLRRDLASQQRDMLLVRLTGINQRLYALTDQLVASRVLLSRTVDVGMMARSAAEQLGLRGPLARAAGVRADLRWDQPYAVYHRLPIRPVVQEGGDVYTRIVVLLLEGLESLKLAEAALHNLPAGEWQGSIPATLLAGQASGAVESPRGLLRYTLESDGRRITSATIDMPHQLDRLLSRTLLVGALLDNVVLIARSTNTCLAQPVVA